MASTIMILSALLLTILALVAIWRGTRRLSAVGNLKNITVSRQWLMEHQGDDHP